MRKEHMPTRAEELSIIDLERPVGTGFVAAYALATLGVYITMLTPASISLSLRVAQLAPQDAAGSLATIASIGGVFALIGNPLFGLMSDRCTSRLGRRRPFILGGLVAAVPAVTIMGLAPNLTGVTIAWCGAQLAISAALAATTAVLADRVPVRQRGRMSGLVQIGIYIAILLGTFVVQLVPSAPVPMFLIPALLAVALAAPLIAVLREPVLDRADVPRVPLRSLLKGLWVSPRRHPDFGWAWLSRFFVYMAAYVPTTFQALLAIDRLHIDAAGAARFVFLSALIYTGGVAGGSLVSGLLSDRSGRYKPFVVFAAVVYGIGMLGMAFTTTSTFLLVGSLIAGIGMGTYASVDLALITRVLPHRGSEDAKDLGLFQVAIALANSVVPAMGPVLLAIGGSGANFAALFCTAGLLAVAGALLALPIRKIR
ncbi:MFS transporter [Amycolatopsis albidoflavus]|uniref:MFS transporter n=2 Tax=Amycolatopsis TaxID=1813 RepID=A0ABW5HTB8_9PSEU